MSKHIDVEKFIADKKEMYCKDCERRKGKKNGKTVTLYDIGEAPCKSCGVFDMFDDLEDYPDADVQKVKHGTFKGEETIALSNCRQCSHCNKDTPVGFYCYYCGAKMDGGTK